MLRLLLFWRWNLAWFYPGLQVMTAVSTSLFGKSSRVRCSAAIAISAVLDDDCSDNPIKINLSNLSVSAWPWKKEKEALLYVLFAVMKSDKHTYIHKDKDIMKLESWYLWRWHPLQSLAMRCDTHDNSWRIEKLRSWLHWKYSWKTQRDINFHQKCQNRRFLAWSLNY